MSNHVCLWESKCPNWSLPECRLWSSVQLLKTESTPIDNRSTQIDTSMSPFYGNSSRNCWLWIYLWEEPSKIHPGRQVLFLYQHTTKQVDHLNQQTQKNPRGTIANACQWRCWMPRQNRIREWTGFNRLDQRRHRREVSFVTDFFTFRKALNPSPGT